MESKDMPPAELRDAFEDIGKFAFEYFSNIENFDVVPKIKPGEIKKRLPKTIPEKGEDIKKILSDFENIILPGVTHWNHPGFHAYFNSNSSGPGIIAESLSAVLNQNGMIWKTSPASAELEEIALEWFRELLGFSKEFTGIIYDTASVSSMHALAAAREKSGIAVRTKGLSGFRLALYASEHAHSSIEKGAITLGIGLENVRKIPVNNRFEMIPEKLEEQIIKDKKEGFKPFAVVATIGTTSTTSVDPVREIAEVCKKENLWLHVDAAYAGPTAMLPEMKKFFDGVESADSIVVNPHKWLFTPIDLSVLFIKDFDLLRRAFSLVPEYLKTHEDNEVINYMDYGLQLGRRFRSLKLWFILRYFGREGLQNILREHLRLAKLFEKMIEESPRFERLAPVHFSTVCFRALKKNANEEELNTLNSHLLDSINARGKIFLSHTKLNGKFTLRFVASSLRTEERHVRKAWEIINEEYEKIFET